MCAEWRGTERSHEDYLAQFHGGGGVPHIFSIEGFRLEGVVIDVMHAVDLGVALHVMGNCIFELIKSGALGRTMAKSLERFWDCLTDWYKTNRITSRIPKLSLEDVRRPGKAPKLQAKAAKARHLVPFVLKMVQDHAKDGDPHDRIKICCVDSNTFRVRNKDIGAKLPHNSCIVTGSQLFVEATVLGKQLVYVDC